MDKRFIIMQFPKREREIECYRLIKFMYKESECYALEFRSQMDKIKYAHLVLEDGVFKLQPFKTVDEEMKFKSRCRTASLYSFDYEVLPLSMLPEHIVLCNESLERLNSNNVVDYNKQVFDELARDINVFMNKVDSEGNYQKINFYDFFQIKGHKMSLEELLESDEYNRLYKLFNVDYVNYFQDDKKKKYIDLCDYFNIFKSYVLYSDNSKKMYDMMYVV